jgi:hypothetical protein
MRTFLREGNMSKIISVLLLLTLCLSILGTSAQAFAPPEKTSTGVSAEARVTAERSPQSDLARGRWAAFRARH